MINKHCSFFFLLKAKTMQIIQMYCLSQAVRDWAIWKQCCIFALGALVELF